MIQTNIPLRNEEKDYTYFLKLKKNQTTNGFTLKLSNENTKENLLNLSLSQTNKNNSNNNSAEKKKPNRFYQVNKLLFNFYNI